MNGFGFTPNKMIPLNDREPGEIAAVAIEQLRRFQNAADTWALQEHKHHSDTHAPQLGMCCRECDKTIYFTHDPHDTPYQYDPADIRALIVAHIRQCHADMVGDNGEVLNESAGKRQVLDDTHNDYPLSKRRGIANRHDDQSGDSRGIEYT